MFDDGTAAAGAKTKKSGRLVVTSVAMIYGSDSVLTKLAYAGGFNSMNLMVCRFLLAAAIFLCLTRRAGEPLLPPVGRRGMVFLIGFLQMCGSLLLYTSFSYLPPTIGVLFYYTYPSLTSLVAHFCYHVRLRRINMLALALSALGLVLLYWNAETTLSLAGICCALGAAAIQGFRLNLVVRVAPLVPVYTYNLNTLLIVGVLGAAVGATGWFGSLSLTGIEPSAWLPFVILAIGVTFLANLLFNRFIHYVGAVEAALIMLLEPPTAAVLAFLLFGDVFSGWQWLGAALVPAAVALSPLAEARLFRAGNMVSVVSDKNDLRAKRIVTRIKNKRKKEEEQHEQQISQ